MKLKFFLVVMIFTIASISWGTTFYPVPIDRQIDSANAVIHAVFNGKYVRKFKEGEVHTVGSFKILHAVGLDKKDVINANDFKIMYPGGSLEGINYQVHGSPRFRKGEEVVLLVHKGGYGFSINDLSLGKYSVKDIDGDKYVSSTVFPFHRGLGKILWSRFDNELSRKFGHGFKSFEHNKYVSNQKLQKNKSSITRNSGRRPASVDDNVEKKSNGNGEFLWLALLFIVLGAGSVYSVTKNR